MVPEANQGEVSVARQRVRVAQARGERVEEVVVCGRDRELWAPDAPIERNRRTPRRPRAEAGRAKRCVETRLQGGVLLQVVRPGRD